MSLKMLFNFLKVSLEELAFQFSLADLFLLESLNDDSAAVDMILKLSDMAVKE